MPAFFCIDAGGSRKYFSAASGCSSNGAAKSSINLLRVEKSPFSALVYASASIHSRALRGKAVRVSEGRAGVESGVRRGACTRVCACVRVSVRSACNRARARLGIDDDAVIEIGRAHV